eukprot:764904-Hanusia_phi.AAC.1
MQKVLACSLPGDRKLRKKIRKRSCGRGGGGGGDEREEKDYETTSFRKEGGGSGAMKTWPFPSFGPAGLDGILE